MNDWRDYVWSANTAWGELSGIILDIGDPLTLPRLAEKLVPEGGVILVAPRLPERTEDAT